MSWQGECSPLYMDIYEEVFFIPFKRFHMVPEGATAMFSFSEPKCVGTGLL